MRNGDYVIAKIKTDTLFMTLDSFGRLPQTMCSITSMGALRNMC